MKLHTPLAPVILLAVLALHGCSDDAPTPSRVLDLSDAALDVVDLPFDMGSVRDLHVAGERLTVLSQFSPHLHLTDLAGGEVRSFGRAGEGPAELRSPQRLLPLASIAGVGVWDAVANRVVVFDTLGALVDAATLQPTRYATVSISLGEQTHGDPLRTVVDGDAVFRVVYDGGAGRPSDLRQGRLVRGGLAAADTATVLEFASILVEGAPEVNVFAPVPLWDRCLGTGATVVLDPDRRELLILSDDSDAQERVPIPLGPRPVTDDDLRRLLFEMALLEGIATRSEAAAIMPELEPFLAEVRDEAPTHVPVAVDLLCFGDRDVWLQEFDNTDDHLGRGSRWLRHDGREWSEVILPRRFQPRALIDGRRLIGVIRSVLDEESVAILSLPPPEIPGPDG